MKQLIYLLMAMPLFFVSCSNDEQAVNGETVEMSFSARLPRKIQSRAEESLPVNQVVCAVFEGDKELKNLRETITLTEESSVITFEPRLIKGKTYNIAFWASNTVLQDGNNVEVYDLSDMTQISRAANVTVDEEYYDAFTAFTEVTVLGASQNKDISLKRPFAKLNVGVTEEDWNTIENLYGLTPSTMTITIKNIKNSFNAVTGEVTGDNNETITYTIDISGEKMECNNTEYKKAAMCFVMPESGKENIDITYSIYGRAENDEEIPIRENVTLNAIPMDSNYNTNVVGGLMTGTITYNISFESDFDKDENKEIE